MVKFFESFNFDDEQKSIKVTNESLPWFLISLLKKYKKISYLCNSEKELFDINNKLRILKPDIEIILFPAFDNPLFSNISPSVDNKSTRITSLIKLLNFNFSELIVLMTLDSVLLKIIPNQLLKNKVMNIDLNAEEKDIDNIKSFLDSNSYNRLDTVRQKGEYAIRGGIFDFFSPNQNFPIRLDTFSSSIESMKFFDPITQLSTENIEQTSIFPSSEVFLEKKSIQNFRVNFRTLNIKNKDDYYRNISEGIQIAGIEQFIPLLYNNLDNFLNLVSNYKFIVNFDFLKKIDDRYKKILSEYENSDKFYNKNHETFLLSKDEIKNLIDENVPVKISSFLNLDEEKSHKEFSRHLDINLKINNTKDSENLVNYIKSNEKKFNILITVKNNFSEGRVKKLLDSLHLDKDIKTRSDDISIINDYIYLQKINLKKGFVCSLKNLKGLIVISDEDLFGKKIYKYTKPNIDAENLISEISSLSKGDLIVHIENGIGKYVGLKNITLNKSIHECVEIEYHNKDKLLIPVENLDLISKYGNKENIVTLDKLGTQNWQLRKSLIKKRIKIIAGDLIKVAAERKLQKGKLMIPDVDLYEKFSSQFEYAETSDQLKAINDIEIDLASGRPMDRLICGDVGYGKTEISMRAAFISIFSGHQVAFLCPTTLLVNQHYKNFKSRFNGFDCKIEKISRFENTRQKQLIFKKVNEQKVDILLGTHALLNDNIKFNNLGLLIIDEEQNFGVEQKEKLKKLRSNVHVLTLTATPIPRTLQSSVLGIKELSLIKTPPVDRLAIKTFLTNYNKMTIKSAITKEIDRGGQIFYVSPRIKDLNLIQNKLVKLMPSFKYEIVHGRLNSNELNKIYNLFFDKKIDVLISTSIIESGLDISNANTIIIEKPNLFGLSQLYQIRGRVGRSEKQSYAYMILPDNDSLSSNALKRLEVIGNLDKLGGGFSIASHDMDIRGAGNILGAEQSGHVKEVGIELYQKLVKDAINETLNKKNIDTDWSPQINLGFSVFIPEDYITSLNLRLNIYRRISNVTSMEKINEILSELNDRFGKVPEELLNLTKLIELKYLCKKANVNKIDLGTKGFIISFRNKKFKGIDKLFNIVNKNPEILSFIPGERILYLDDSFEKNKKIKNIVNFLKILSKL